VRSARSSAALAGLLAGTALAVAACGTDAPETRDLSVMTQNMYLGADVTELFGASSTSDLAGRATRLWEQVQNSDVPGRVNAVARAIYTSGVDVVGLQEVSLWRTDPAANGPVTPATDVELDVLTMLTDALDELAGDDGQQYEVGPVAEEFDGEVPTNLGFDVRLTDRDVILYRTGGSDLQEEMTVESVGSGQFDAALEVEAIPGTTVTVPRGWTAVDVTLGGDRTVRVYNTHLEAIEGPEQEAQGAELRSLAADSSPVVVLGDFNSGPEQEVDTPTYQQFLDDGYRDAWGGDPGSGATCCQSPDLRNPSSRLDTRIDIIMLRGVSSTGAARLGASEEERTKSGMWPSDHAGVTAALLVRVPE